MHALFTLLLAAAAPGVDGVDALTLTLNSEKLVPKIGVAAFLKPLFADEKTVRASLALATKDVPADTIKDIAANIVASRKKLTSASKGYRATHAVVSMDAVNAVVRFSDGAGHAIDFEWIRPGGKGKRLMLLTAPAAYDAPLEDLLRYGRETAGAQLFVRDASGAWTAAPMSEGPKEAPGAGPPKDTCTERLRAKAKKLYVAQESYRAENDVYTTNGTAAGVDAASLGATSFRIDKADASTFSAEVTAEGGVVRINEKLEIVVVTPCKEPAKP